MFMYVFFLVWLHGSWFYNLYEEHVFCLLDTELIFTCFTGAQFDIGSQVVGQKDMSKNVLDIWKEVISTTIMNLSILGYNF